MKVGLGSGTSNFFAGREDSVGHDSKRGVVVVDLDLVERNADTSRGMGPRRSWQPGSTGPLVGWLSTDGPSRTRSTTRSRTFDGSPGDRSGKPSWVAGEAR